MKIIIKTIGIHPVLIVVLCLFSNLTFAQSWDELDQLNRSRFEASTVQFNDDLYVFNGFGPGIRIEPTVEKFNAGTKRWSVISGTSVQKGNAVTHNGIVRVGNEAWLIGGRKGSHPGKVSNQVWKFNLSNAQWTPGPALPVPVAAGGAALVNNRIHWIGGLDPQAKCDVGHHYVYDLSLPTAGWQNITNVARMPQPRNHFSTVVHNGLIYTIGGQFGHDNCPGKNTQDTNLVHVFNPKNNTWTQKASLPTKQSHAEPSSFVYGGAIYVAGGETKGNKIFRYNPRNNAWKIVADLPETVVAPVARVIDDRLIVAAGGAPNVHSPSNRTRSIAVAPLLLPDAAVASNGNSGNNSNNNSSNTPAPETQAEPEVIPPQPEPVVAPPQPEPVATSFTLAPGEAVISLEAEYFDTNTSTPIHSWVTTNRAGASNDAAVVTTPDIGDLAVTATGSAELSYFALFDRPGTWYLWVRGWGDTNAAGEGRSDSLHAGLNGQVQQSADEIDQFPVGWHWSNSTRDTRRATIAIPAAGLHVVNLWMREDGLAVDKIILTTDAVYVPTGSGPTHDNGGSPGGGGASSDTTSDDTPSGDTALEDTLSEDTLSEDTVSEDTVSEDTVSEDTVSEEIVILEVSPSDSDDNQAPQPIQVADTDGAVNTEDSDAEGNRLPEIAGDGETDIPNLLNTNMDGILSAQETNVSVVADAVTADVVGTDLGGSGFGCSVFNGSVSASEKTVDPLFLGMLLLSSFWLSIKRARRAKLCISMGVDTKRVGI